jgi:hypothetical protein
MLIAPMTIGLIAWYHCIVNNLAIFTARRHVHWAM